MQCGKLEKIIQGVFKLWKVDLCGDSKFLQGTNGWQVTSKPRRPSVAWLRSDKFSPCQPLLSNAVSKYRANYC